MIPNPGNPMQLFNRNLSPQQLMQLQQLQVLLGGLGQKPASSVTMPSLMSPIQRPEPNKEGSILGGTGSG